MSGEGGLLSRTFSLRRGSSKLRRRGSTKSLAPASATSPRLDRQASVRSLALPTSFSAEEEGEGWRSTLRRKLSLRRFSSVPEDKHSVGTRGSSSSSHVHKPLAEARSEGVHL